jgi:VIT1/CCC1 family predicted Fe2+/Mn2+ transporter
MEGHSGSNALVRQVILGGQDGVVNILGLVLGVASATKDSRIVIIAGVATAFAESFSMAAVAYTSARAMHDFYDSELQREKQEIEEVPHFEREEIREIYSKKGFRGKLLDRIVRTITSNKKIWLKVMMEEELNLSMREFESPKKEAAVVGLSAFAGSLIPIAPFFVLPVFEAMIVSALACSGILFVGGAIKARLTIGSWWRSGLEIMGVGMVAGMLGYVVGTLLGAASF